MKSINAGLAKKYGKPLSYTDGEHTKAKSSAGGKNASIMANANTKSDRCGYGVNGV